MLSKNTIQFVRLLQQKKFREKFGCFIVEGPKLVDELLASHFDVKSVYATSDWIKSKLNTRDNGTEVFEVSQNELERMSHFKTPNQVLAVAEIPKQQFHINQLTGNWFLALDGINDPGNLGTIIRTADWYGIRNIVCSPDTVEYVNPKVVQSTMGSIFRVDIYYTDLNHFLQNLKPDFPLYGTFMDGNNVYNESFGEEGMLVLGSESHGISTKVENIVKTRLHIPSNQSQAESLNVSVAAAICCSEIKRSGLMKIY